ncbi:8-oxo-dGTP pyrophosphatase MutT, NUDIX family [Methylocapsa palsarum]|uniref:8-oxo-dGTP pyrophosphatase MutT, NUDIX family n=2 Tax=Methylocapsa palsarum TaxID=1612308 RepID=A0A1I3WVD3_9HYPH|nr:8-oxo-dGTP pyrophosphatase MutT, NUDIX family [Methylocapsa palsarum]
MQAAATSEEKFSPLAVFDHVRARLERAADRQGNRRSSSGAGLFTMMDGSVETVAEPERSMAAAVLVGLIAYPDEIKILLTQRAAALRVHAGQIAFPGGKIEQRDESPLGAALREAQEEIGLDARQVEPLGYLEPYFTGTGFRIVPAVVKITPPVALTINPDEVEDIFEVPFAFLMDQANHALHTREFEGVSRQFYAMPYGERHIWGVTAGILRNLYERLYS